MSRSLSDYTKTVEAEQVQEADRKKIAQPPAGWEPGVAWSGESGTLVSKPVDTPDPQLGSLLEQWGFDPNEYEIVGDLAFRTWEAQTAEGLRQLYSYRATIRRRSASEDESDRLDFEDLVKEIKAYKPPKRKAPSGEQAFVVCLADYQIGKSDLGGTEAIVKRIVDSISAVKERYTELRKAGRRFGELYVMMMGDITENVCGMYPGQEFMVDLSLRDQKKVARRLVRDQLRAWVPDFERIVVSGVAGNHGELRINGKRGTEDEDNNDLSLVEELAEIFAENPAFDHVKFTLPNNPFVGVWNVAGTTIGFMHAHKAERSPGVGLPQVKILNWWRDQTFNGQPVGDAKVLVSAHYHHFSAIEHSEGRLHLQCPAMDNGSQWWIDGKGAQSTHGLLTFTSGSNGINDIQIVS